MAAPNNPYNFHVGTQYSLAHSQLTWRHQIPVLPFGTLRGAPPHLVNGEINLFMHRERGMLHLDGVLQNRG